MKPHYKKYILENLDKMSVSQIAGRLGIKERKVKKIIRIEKEKRKAVGAVLPLSKVGVQPVKKAIVYASIALIIILGFAVYANSLNGKFVFDDSLLIKDNIFIKNLSILPKVFTQDIGSGSGIRYSFYRPIHMLTYALDYHFWKLNEFGFHLTSVILHILVALCIYWFISILFQNKIISLLTAIFFAVHPIHTTVVSYISTRAEALYLLFLLISFIFYIKSLSHTDTLMPYLAMLFCYALALLSKENALILPVLILVYHYAFREKVKLRVFLSIVSIACIYIVLRLTMLKHLLSGVVPNGTLIERLPGFFVALCTYMRLMLLPLGLHVEYGRTLFNFTDPKAICGLGILAGLIFCAFKTKKTNKPVFFCLLWFLITLLPVSNLYPLNAYMSENWLYLPSIGLFIILAVLLSSLYKKQKLRIFVVTFIVCLLACYAYLTIKQNDTWREPIAFYERTIKYAPGSSRVHNNLANIYKEMGKKKEALALYKKAIELNPDSAYAETYTNLANLYSEMGNKQEALVLYRKAIETNSDCAGAYYNLANILYLDMGKKEEAMSLYRKAIEINPTYAGAYNNLANILFIDMGKQEEALALYRKAIEINPNSADTYNNLGSVYYRTGKKEEALFYYQKALEVNPNFIPACENLAHVYYEQGKYDLAIKYYDRALLLGAKVDPDFMKALSPFRKIENR